VIQTGFCPPPLATPRSSLPPFPAGARYETTFFAGIFLPSLPPVACYDSQSVRGVFSKRGSTLLQVLRVPESPPVNGKQGTAGSSKGPLRSSPA